MSDSRDGRDVVVRDTVDEPLEEVYRPDLVARLERAVRLGTYRPDARAIADALLTRIEELE
jgi:anti-sigma28 factor (negative regulator of flagellin synthesis)